MTVLAATVEVIGDDSSAGPEWLQIVLIAGITCAFVGVLVAYTLTHGRRLCSHCRGWIAKGATVCPHCQREAPLT